MTFEAKNALRKSAEYRAATAARKLRKECDGKFGARPNNVWNELVRGTSGAQRKTKEQA